MGWLAKIRVCLITTAALVIITLAVAFSVLRAVLPHATGYLAEVEQALEKQLGLPVEIAALDADMHWLTPRLKLLGVRVFNIDGKTVLVEFSDASFALSYLDSLRYMSPMIGDIGLSGADLSVERDQQGRWFLQGIQIAAADSEQISDELVSLLNNMNFSLQNSHLHLRDHTRALEDMDFQNIDVQVENLLGTHSFQARVDLPERYGKSLHLIAEINGDLSRLEAASAEVYLNANALQLEPVLGKLGLDNQVSAQGVADAESWLTIESKQVKQFRTRAAFTNLELRAPQHKQGWRVDALSANVLWQQYADAWRLDVVDFKLRKNSVDWALPGNLLLRQNAAAGYLVTATYFRPADLAGLAALVRHDQYRETMETITALQLQGDVYNLNISLPPKDSTNTDNVFEVSAAFQNAGFTLAEQNISITGLDGKLHYLDRIAHLLLASTDIVVDLGSVFRQPLELQALDAMLTATRGSRLWEISADSIRMKNADIDTRSRLFARLPDVGELYLDMQTDYQNADGAAALKYYPAGVMSKAVVDWLDASLSGGHVDSGSFIYKGSTTAFPFNENEGVMEVLFQPRDATLKFLPNWPAIENLSASVRFHNKSLQISNASARVYQGRLTNANAMIANLDAIVIELDGDIHGPANDIQQYIWNSGLDAILGDAMRQFQVTGDVEIYLMLSIPLADNNTSIASVGSVKFSDNQLGFPAMQYQFDQLSGVMDFTNRSIHSDSLTASFDGSPISVNVATVKSPRNEAVFNIRGQWSIDTMLARFQSIPPDWFSGESAWNVAVHVPFASGQDVNLSVSSTLQGSSIAVSDMMSKVAQDKLPLQLNIKLLGDAMQLTARSKNVFDVFANRDEQNRWHTMIDSPWLIGEIEFEQSLSPRTTIDMNFEYADLYALAKSRHTDTNGAGLEPASIPSLKFHADKLDWNAWKLNSVDLSTLHHSHGMLIESISVSAPAMTLTGKGSWLSSWQQPHNTNFKLKVNSENLGESLVGLGYPRIVDRGKLSADIDWQWLAEPYRFSLPAVSGVASFKLDDGAILDVKPGAGGRLLGLLNVLHLPRRFLFDFDDVYKDGFVFDTITGDMAFAEDNATTRNVRIEAASANILMNGRVGLEAEDYDLEMEVRPNSSAATFTGGTLAGGPIVGAGLVLLEKLFGVDKLAREKYSITGKWDNPVIVQTEKADRANKTDENAGI